ncbi:C39 family peptidase [Leptospirillum ferriphilum]|uniref:Peptidase C39-like domain-containing protein n=2 Tax=Leptospirillum ferriphilum TaxID=178606 RepID=A0A1V3SXQ2_9BACT|nr:papain-like cysteine protease family protein [Leptospirillum ferriphilum]AFS53605.1 hypothetical protein LFML04_1387 [Leptospirillum ferriphilum ML-04]OOH74672.1 hypothetical protein BOX24_01620 [Leptospirillum ferriphilum]
MKNQRQKILPCIVLTLLLWMGWGEQASFADWTLVGPKTYIVGIPPRYVHAWAHPRRIGRQKESNWCWAASVAMVLNFAHVPVTQEQIVKRMFGSDVNRPANMLQIMQAIDGWRSRFQGKVVVVKAFLEPSSEQILHDLYLNYPVILALKVGDKIGHAVVVTAAKFTEVNGGKQVDYFLVRDPWPNNPSEARLEPPLFKDIVGAIGVRISLRKE